MEDIAAPRCFEIERRLREELDIPVFHDDQHGTAIVVLAALINAARVVEKTIADAKIVVSGAGAAAHAIIRLLHAQGAGHIVAGDRSGVIHRGETYGDDHRRWIADNTNPDSFAGSLHDALRYYEPAKELISRLCLSDEFTDFLTLPAYEQVS